MCVGRELVLADSGMAAFLLLLLVAATVPITAKNAYNETRSIEMLNLARIAYCQDLTKVASWTCKLCLQYKGQMENVTTVANKSLGDCFNPNPFHISLCGLV